MDQLVWEVLKLRIFLSLDLQPASVTFLNFNNKITAPNTVSWGNKLVTVFADPNLDRIPTA